MMRRQSLQGLLAMTLGLGLSVQPGVAWAIPVFDAANFVHNVISATTAVKNEINTAATLIQATRTAIAQIRALASVDGLARLAGLEEELANYRDLKQVGQDLLGAVNDSKRLFKTLEGDFGASQLSWHEFLTQRAQLAAQRGDAIARHFAHVTASLQAFSDKRQQIVDRLADAGGPTEATQLVGAAIGNLIEQQQQMLSLMVATGQATEIRGQEAQASRQAAMKLLQQRQQGLLDAADQFRGP